MFQDQYEKYKSGKEMGDRALNMVRVYFDEACPDQPPEFHRILLHWFFSHYNKTVCAAPRGHAKSTMCSKIGIICSIMLRLDHCIVICSETLQQATDLLSAIKNEFINNQKFCEDIGFRYEDCVQSWNQETIEFTLKDGFQCKISAKSASSSFRGTKFNNWRPSLVLLDDIEGEENTSTPEQRAKLKKWLMSVIIPAMDPKNQRLRFVGTVLHEDSLLNNCLRNKKWAPVIFKAHNSSFTQILWAARFTKKFLLELKEDFDLAGTPHLYSQEYLNTCIPEGGAFFDVDKIEYVTSVKEGLDYYTACDLAVSQTTQADYTVIATVAVDKDVMTLVDLKRGRVDTPTIVEWLLATERQFHPVTVTIEKGAIEKSITPYLELEEQKYATYLSKVYVAPVKDKKSRARGLQGVVKTKRFQVIAGIDDIDQMKHELEKFGSARHDDIVDALSYLCSDLQRKLESVNEDEAKIIEKEEFQDMTDYFDSSDDENWGW